MDFAAGASGLYFRRLVGRNSLYQSSAACLSGERGLAAAGGRIPCQSEKTADRCYDAATDDQIWTDFDILGQRTAGNFKCAGIEVEIREDAEDGSENTYHDGNESRPAYLSYSLAEHPCDQRE